MLWIVAGGVVIWLAFRTSKKRRRLDSQLSQYDGEYAVQDPFGMNHNPLIILVGWAYTTFKWLIFAGLIVGIGISIQCHKQMLEVCQIVSICDKDEQPQQPAPRPQRRTSGK
jgi:hypothetical protein